MRNKTVRLQLTCYKIVISHITVNNITNPVIYIYLYNGKFHYNYKFYLYLLCKGEAQIYIWLKPSK